ncbi:hypothetical protein ACXKZH_24805 [Priestia megaterium]
MEETKEQAIDLDTTYEYAVFLDRVSVVDATIVIQLTSKAL